jgi:hypothetical protein
MSTYEQKAGLPADIPGPFRDLDWQCNDDFLYCGELALVAVGFEHPVPHHELAIVLGDAATADIENEKHADVCNTDGSPWRWTWEDVHMFVLLG